MNSSNEPSEALVGSGVSRLLEESGQFDYVFTQCELEEVLAGGGTLPPSFDAGDGILRDSLQPSALQFMPHEPLDPHAHINPSSMPTTAPLPIIPSTTLSTHMYYEIKPEPPIAPKPTWFEPIHSGGASDKQKRGARRAGPSAPTKSPKAGPTVAIGPDGKPQISHSVVEKQRRDRINNLIDELREIVPPQESSPTDTKRPKHVVLADTIALVRDMQVKVRTLFLVSCVAIILVATYIITPTCFRCGCRTTTKQRAASLGRHPPSTPWRAPWAPPLVRSHIQAACLNVCSSITMLQTLCTRVHPIM